MPTTHKLYGGSNADIWVNCAGSTWLSTQVPRQPAGRAAEEGTAQHACMEMLLQDENLEPASFLGSTVLGIEITKEHVTAIDVALNEYLNIVETFSEHATILSETSVDLNEECGGTMDVGIVNGTRAAIIDFKFGQIEVEPDGLQGLLYGVAALESLPAFKDIEVLENYIIQPVYDPATVKIVYPVTHLATMKRTFLNAIAVSKSNDPSFTEGDWCTWCPGKLVCPVKLKGLETLTKPEHILDLNELGARALKIREWIEWNKAAEERIELELEHGRKVSGWKLVNKRGRGQWKSEAKAIVEFKRLGLSEDTYAPRKIVSPNQAKEQGLLNAKTVKEMSEVISSGHTIAPESDKRPAVLPTAALQAAMNRVK